MNHIVLLGRLTRAPEIRVTQTGMQIARYTLACDRRDKENNTDFLDCVAFDKAAAFAEKYFTKGQRVLVSGRVQPDKYTNKEGQSVTRWEVVVSTQEFADGKQTGDNKPKEDSGFMPVADEGLPFE